MPYVYELGKVVDIEKGFTIDLHGGYPAFGIEPEQSKNRLVCESYATFKAERENTDFFFTYYEFNQQLWPGTIKSFRRAVVLKTPLVFSAFVAAELKADRLPQLYPSYKKVMYGRLSHPHDDHEPTYWFFKWPGFLKFVEEKQRSGDLANEYLKFLPVLDEIKKGLCAASSDNGRLTESTYSFEMIEKATNESIEKIASEFAETSAKLIASLGKA